VRSRAVGQAAPGERHHEGAAAAVAHRALELARGTGGIPQREVRDRHQPAARVAAEVGDPAVVGAAVGERELGVLELGLPQDADRGIEHGSVEVLGVEPLEPLLHVHRAVRRTGEIGPLGAGAHVFDVHLPHRAERSGEAAAREQRRAAADLQILETLVVDPDAQRAVAVRGLQVALPQVGRLEDVPVGVDRSVVADAVDVSHGSIVLAAGGRCFHRRLLPIQER